MELYTGTARFDQAVSALCPSLKEVLMNIPQSVRQSIFEVRLRAGKPIALTCPNKTWFVDAQGQLHNIPAYGRVVTMREISDSVVTLCTYSVHSHQQEIKNGFISMPGGHRAGICGTAVTDGSAVDAVRDISSVNLRIARDVRGVATPLIERIFSKKLCGLLIIGIPSSGKTTVLRDLARQLACGNAGHRHYKVAVIDERCELAAVYEGVAQNDLGPCCDILSGYPKAQGIHTAVRTLSPDVILCDEIGGSDEVESILDGVNCGVCMVATAHASSVGELLRRPQILRLLEHGVFERIAVLGGADLPGHISSIVEVGEHFAQSDGHDPHRSVFLDGGVVHGLQLVRKSDED